jgi:hypothetical protein
MGQAMTTVAGVSALAGPVIGIAQKIMQDEGGRTISRGRLAQATKLVQSGQVNPNDWAAAGEQILRSGNQGAFSNCVQKEFSPERNGRFNSNMGESNLLALGASVRDGSTYPG